MFWTSSVQQLQCQQRQSKINSVITLSFKHFAVCNVQQSFTFKPNVVTFHSTFNFSIYFLSGHSAMHRIYWTKNKRYLTTLHQLSTQRTISPKIQFINATTSDWSPSIRYISPLHPKYSFVLIITLNLYFVCVFPFSCIPTATRTQHSNENENRSTTIETN